MRGLTPAIPSPHPIGQALPALYQSDEFTQSFTGGLDDVLAPVFATLDSLDAYLDPRTTPSDFLGWLAGWVGVELDEDWPIERRRALVADTVRLYGIRGTVEGLRRLVELWTGGEVEIVDSGGVVASTTTGASPPGDEVPQVTIRVRNAPAGTDAKRVERLVAAAKPAHVRSSVTLERA